MVDGLAWLWVPVLACLAGGVLGAIFFGGLWWTVRHGASSARPALWFFGSSLVRTGLVLPGFYFAAGGQPARLALCLLGFIVARGVVLRATRPSQPGQTQLVSKGPPCA